MTEQQHPDDPEELEPTTLDDLPPDDPAADRAFEQAQRLAAFHRPDATITERVTMPIAELVASSMFQIRAALKDEAVRTYAARYAVDATMEPIKVARVLGGNGRPVYYVVDGFHRVEALKRIGRTEAEATITEMDSLNDVKWAGWEANQHGVQYTKDERIAAFKLYLTMGQHLYRPRPKAQMELKSIRQIGKEWGRNPDTIWKLIKKVNRPLYNRYRARNAHMKGRAATNHDAPPTYRKLSALDSVRSDCRSIINIAKGELPDTQKLIVLAAETMLTKLNNLDAQEKPWTPDPTDF